MTPLTLRLRLISVLLRMAAWVWRRLLLRTTFIGITGSVGKTTAKDCLAACLASIAPVCATPGNQNDGFFGLPKSILRVRPWHRFAVIEAGTVVPNHMAMCARILAPDVALVVAVARSHTKSFPTLEEIAVEKQQLLDYLRPGGLAILNGNDSLVSTMRVPPGRTAVRYGANPELNYTFHSCRAEWPQRLSFTAETGSESQLIETNLVGAHWISSVLGAIAVAHKLGLSLQQAAAALREVAPYTGRMQPVEVDGSTFLRDDFKGSVATFAVSLAVLREAKAQRRVVICGDLSDSGIRHQKRLATIGASAAAGADLAVFVGQHAELAMKHALLAGAPPEAVRGFVSLEDAAEFVRLNRHPGDLILLTGQTTDHVSRILHAQTGHVSCWKPRCTIPHACDGCPDLRAGSRD